MSRRQTNPTGARLGVLLAVHDERDRQEAAFPMPDGFPAELRTDILVEEVGEVAKARLEWLRDGAPVEELRAELVQVAATAVRWIEVLDAERDAADAAAQ